jgi:hypothetical protein
MDKATLMQYGWIVVISLILSVLFVIATPLGTAMAESTISLVRGTAIFSNEAYSDDSIKEQSDYMENLFDYSDVLEPGLYKHNDPATRAFTWDEYVDNSYVTVVGKILNRTSKTVYTNGDLVIGDNVETLGSNAFLNASSLYLIRLGVATKTIEPCAFDNCVNLEIFRSNKHLMLIGAYAFRNNYNLKSVYLENELRTIGAEAFYNCYKLKEIHYNGTMQEWYDILKVASNNPWYPNSLEKIICTDGEILMKTA